MQWCHTCSSEIDCRKRKCPECGQPLGKGPGFTKPISYLNREWFTIRVVTDHTMADALRDFLEMNGYDVVIRNGNGLPGEDLEDSRSDSTNEVLVPAENAHNAARLIRTNSAWEGYGSGVSTVGGIVEDDEFKYEEEGYDDDEQGYIQSRVRMNGIDDFDDMY